MTCTSRCRDLKPMNPAAADAADAAGKPWTHVASLGEFPGTIEIPAGYDVPGHGVVAAPLTVEGVTVFGEAQLESMVQRFDADVLIDYDHLSHDLEQTTEAAGWGIELRRSADRQELELQTDWAAPARDKIAGQVYRYISPEFSGAVRYEGGGFRFYPSALTGAGLTNRPKLKALRPVSANRQTAPPFSPIPMNYKTTLLKLLGLPETATDEEMAAKQAALTTEEAAETAASHNRATRLTALETENRQLKDEAVSRDLETYAAVIEDQESARELLQLNRAATVKTFAAQLAKQAAGPVAMIYQRNRATAPDGKTFSAAEDGQATAARDALVATVKNRDRCDFATAWTTAKAEKPELF